MVDEHPPADRGRYREHIGRHRLITMVEMAIRNAVPRRPVPTPRWAVVRDLLGLGSTGAHDVCRYFSLDPEEMLVRAHDDDDEG